MISLIVIGGGIAGIFFAGKCRIQAVWAFLVCTLISAYLAILSTPCITALFSGVNGVHEGVKKAGILFGVFILLEILLYKIVSAAVSEQERNYDLSKIIRIPFSALTGFLSGLTLTAFLVFAFMAFPFARNRQGNKTHSEGIDVCRKYAVRIVKTGNFFMWKTFDRKQEDIINRFLSESGKMSMKTEKKRDGGQSKPTDGTSGAAANGTKDGGKYQNEYFRKRADFRGKNDSAQNALSKNYEDL